MTSHGVLLTVAYEGTAFHGWAAQPGTRTVEDALKSAILAVDAGASAPRGTSRTDAGVHAEAQMVAFDAALEIPPRGWVLALNRHLPDDVAVRSARAVTPGYNPRFSNKRKRYRYRLLLDRVRNPLERTRAWRIGWRLDEDALTREAALIVGKHDFAAFRTASDLRPSTVRTISRVAVEPLAGRVTSVVVEGEAFLHNMVRILVGTLVDVARGELAEGAITRALATKRREDAGTTAPGHGLTLEWVELDLPSDAGEPWPR